MTHRGRAVLPKDALTWLDGVARRDDAGWFQASGTIG